MNAYVSPARQSTHLRAKLFRGLADPTRLALVEGLRDAPRGVSELVELTGLAQPNVSKHLACLLECGLVTVNREGRTATYRLVPTVESLLAAADTVLGGAGPRIDTCPNYEERPDHSQP